MTDKINGFKLQQLIREQLQRRDFAAARFAGAIKAFPGDKKENPSAIMADYREAENVLATLQVAQDRFNLDVIVEIQGHKMPACGCC